MIASKNWVYLYLAVGVGLLDAQGVTYVASNPSGPAFEFVARGDQSGDTASTYGYLSHIDGIDDASLFTNGQGQAPNETNARFTLVTTLTFTSRFANANVIVGVQDETMSVYFTEFPTARDFTKPETFAQGDVVATFHNRVQTVLNVQTPISQQGPGMGIIHATTQATEQGSTAFTLGGKSYALGRIGSAFRMEATGEGTLTSASPLTAHFVFGGFAEEANRRLFFRF
jgi:hypothetical protein